MGTAIFVLLWWIALFGWWILLVGTNAGLELLAGACAASLATVLAAGAAPARAAELPLPRAVACHGAEGSWRVLYECGVVFAAR